MHHYVTVAGSNHCQSVHARGEVREKVGDFDPALAMLAERPLRAEQFGFALDELILGLAELFWPRLTIQFVEQRFGIECFQMTGPARHEEEDDGLRFRRLMRGSRRQ